MALYLTAEGNMRKQTSCSLMVEECSLMNHLRYSGLLIVGLVDKPWQLVAGLLLGIAALVERQWVGTPMGAQKLLVALFVLWVVDTISGTIVGWVRHDFSSARFGCTIVKALVYSLGIIAAETLDECTGLGNAFLVTLTTWMVLREASSFVENSALLGFPWPKSLVRRLTALREAIEESEPDGDGGGRPADDV